MNVNPHFRPVDLAHASRLINHGPTVLVTSQHGEHRNVMAAAWSMPVEFVPPRISVVIDKKTFTRELVQASGHLGLCIPGAGVARLVHAVGSETGRDPGTHGEGVVDKFTRHAMDARPGPVLGVPVVEGGMVAWLECRLIPEPHTEEAYDTCFAEVVAAAADERVFSNGRWHFSDQHLDLHTLHYLGGGQFVRSGAVISL